MNVLKKVYFMGSSGLMYQCANLVKKDSSALPMKILETGHTPSDLHRAEKYHAKTGSKQELFGILREETEYAILFSVNNPYLIPADIVAKDNFTMVNLHHALLPAHPGRNAEAWTIYDGDTEAGITWHRIDAGTDSGNILVQKSVPVTDETTSLKLLKLLNREAVSALKELLPLSSIPDKQGVVQPVSEGRLIRYAKDVPADGLLHPEWDGVHISRFLRAMDYDLLEVMGKPRVIIDGSERRISEYRILKDNDKSEASESEYVISKDGFTFYLSLDGAV